MPQEPAQILSHEGVVVLPCVRLVYESTRCSCVKTTVEFCEIEVCAWLRQTDRETDPLLM